MTRTRLSNSIAPVPAALSRAVLVLVVIGTMVNAPGAALAWNLQRALLSELNELRVELDSSSHCSTAQQLRRRGSAGTPAHRGSRNFPVSSTTDPRALRSSSAEPRSSHWRPDSWASPLRC